MEMLVGCVLVKIIYRRKNDMKCARVVFTLGVEPCCLWMTAEGLQKVLVKGENPEICCLVSSYLVCSEFAVCVCSSFFDPVSQSESVSVWIIHHALGK